MNDSDFTIAIGWLRGKGITSVSRVTLLQGTREGADGLETGIIIEIHDHGPEAGDYRYSVTITDVGGGQSTGDAAPSIDLALSSVHMGRLDMP